MDKSGGAVNADGASSAQTPSLQQIRKAQAEVDEIVGIMRGNVQQILEREHKLSDLDERADALQQAASQFALSARRLNRKMWWKNVKVMIIIGVIVATLLIIIIVSLFVTTWR